MIPVKFNTVFPGRAVPGNIRIQICRQQVVTAGQDAGRAAANVASILLAGIMIVSPPAFAAEDTPLGGDSHLRGPLRAILRAPADFYRSRQQSNGGSIFLGPIQLSRQHLEAALNSLDGPEGSAAYAAALKSLRSASMQCAGPEITTASSEGQEYKLGDPCKLRLVVKNATILTRDAALVSGARQQVTEIIHGLQLADDILDRAQEGDEDAAKVAPSLIRDALKANSKLEETVKRCLGFAA